MRRMAVLDGAADLVHLMRGALAGDGWDVEVFPDEQSLASAKGGRSDVVLVEIGTNQAAEDWEMLTRLKSNGKTAALPVVVTSASHFELQNHNDLLSENAAAVLVRPCTDEDIRRCLQAALEQAPARS